MTRSERLLKLIESYGHTPHDYDEGEEEDPRPYISGEKACERWCCVTVNFTSHGKPKWFFLPIFAERDAAELRAVEYAGDDIFEELPVAVVDLDSGEEYVVAWDSLGFRRKEVGRYV